MSAQAAPEGLAAISPERLVLGIVATLTAFGLVMVYSASAMISERIYGDSATMLKLQIGWAVVGFAGLYWASTIPRDSLQRKAGLFFLIASACCLIVMIPGLGHLAGGQRRWLRIGMLGFQPSELAKLALVVFMARALARRHEKVPNKRTSLLVPIAVAQLPVILVVGSDLGTALVMEVLIAAMVFAAGLRLRTLFWMGLAALPFFYHYAVATPFRLRRILGFMDPWAYRSTIGYQVTEALIAIGSGGISGVGLGESRHKLFLPAAHNDFIFAIVGEETGLIGITIVVLMFALLIARAVQISVHASNAFDSYLALGIAALIGVPAAFNLCVATGLLPTKGLSLPLLSHGGSNLFITLFAVGLLIRIGRGVSHNPRESA